MKMNLRFMLILIISGLLLILSHLALIKSSAAAYEGDDIAGQIELTLRDEPSPNVQIGYTKRPISELSISYSSPTTATFATYFTATVTGGTPPIVFNWDFGDGTRLSSNTSPVVSHKYSEPGTYTVVVTASNVVGQVSDTITVEVADPNGGPIIGLEITHTVPVYLQRPIHFTATHLTGALPISYAWDFGDGNVLVPPDAKAVASHTYTAPGSYMVSVVAFNNVGPVVVETIEVPVPGSQGPTQLFLPIIFKTISSSPSNDLADLHCDIRIEPPNPTAQDPILIVVKVGNHGVVEADGFWVDLYLNPSTVPTQGHLLRWQDACGGPSSCKNGIAWGFEDEPLGPGITRTLVSLPGSYDPESSEWVDLLPAGNHDIYVYVDSINPVGSQDGAILESNEENNRCEKLNFTVTQSSSSEINRARSNDLPKR